MSDPFFIRPDVSNAITPVGALIVQLFVIFFASHVAQTLPDNVMKYFSYTWVKVAFMALFVWLQLRDPITSFLIALALLMIMNTISGRKPFDSFKNIQTNDMYLE